MILWLLLLAVAATAPALCGLRTLGPESLLDADPLYRVGPAPPPPLVGDSSRTVYDLPRDFAAAAGLRQGRLDLWNPRPGFGLPLWGEGGSVFFPLNFPFYLAPSIRTYDLATALRLVVAGLGAFLLARRRGLGSIPALAAASLFELSGAMMTLLQFGSAAPPCLLPWAVLGAEEIARTRRLAAAVGSGIALGLAALAGHPGFAVTVFAGFGAAIGAEAFWALRTPRAALGMGVLAALAVVLGLVIGAPALLPLLERLSVGRLYKHVGSYPQGTVVWAAYQRALLPVALFAPFTMLKIRDLLAWTIPYCLSPIVGLAGLVFALTGLLRRGLSPGLLGVLVLGVATTLAPPGLSWLRTAPLIREVWPCYWWSLVALPLGQAAGWGVAALEINGQRRFVLMALGIAIVASSLLLLVHDYTAEQALLPLPIRTVFMGALAGRAGWYSLIVPAALVTVAVVALVAGRPRWVTDRRAAVATGLVALELLVGLGPASWQADSKVLASPPSAAVRFLQTRLASGDYRMLGNPFPFLVPGYPGTPSLFGLQDGRAIAAVPAERHVRYLEAVSPTAIWYFLQDPGLVRHPLLDLAAVRFLVRPPGPDPALERDPAVRLVYRDASVAIYENSAALPRGRIVHGALPVRDQDEAAAGLTAAAAADVHAADVGLATRILVEPSADGRPAPPSPDAELASGETVRISEQSDPDRVELAVSLATAGWVVLADTFYPGWTASIDGVPAAIHPADLLFRAVHVPPGAHRVVFLYEPRAFRLGVVLAVIGIGACVILFWWDAAHPRGHHV